MQQSRIVNRDALAEAAATRASVAPIASSHTTPAVKDAVKAFNREIVSIPDYLHYRPQFILDGLNLIRRICSDLITHGGKSPKNLTQPLKIKLTVFRSKTHGLEHAYSALLMLGFKEVVVDMQKHLEYCGRFHQDADQNHAFLTHVVPLVDTTIEGVEKHIQMSSDDKHKRKLQQEAGRVAALARIDADREAQHARAAREHAARQAAGTTAIKSPWKPEQRQAAAQRRRSASGMPHSMGGTQHSGEEEEEEGDDDDMD
eukprot:jgi/Ulvmu1/360/UM001_0366.1